MENRIQKFVIVVSCVALLALMGLCVRLERELIRPQSEERPGRDTTVQTTDAADRLTEPTGVELPAFAETEPQKTSDPAPAVTTPATADPVAPPPETTIPPEITTPPETTEPEQTTPVTSPPPSSGLGDTELPPV